MVIPKILPQRLYRCRSKESCRYEQSEKQRSVGTGADPLPDQKSADRIRYFRCLPAGGCFGPHGLHCPAGTLYPGRFAVRTALPSASAAPPEIKPDCCNFAFSAGYEHFVSIFVRERKIAVFCKLSNNLLTSTSCYYYNRFIRIERYIRLIFVISTRKGLHNDSI